MAPRTTVRRLKRLALLRHLVPGAIRGGSQIFFGAIQREAILLAKFVEFVAVFTDYWPRIPRIGTN